MEQKTDEWLDWRKKGIGSSDAPIIMLDSPWKTPFELWQEKTGRVAKESVSNFAQERGNAIEPIARARYELECDIEMGPALCQHSNYPWMRASMDGWNPLAKRGLEIKYVGVEDFEGAKAGFVPRKYIPQLQHQFMVTGAEQIDFYAYSVAKGVEIHRGQTVLVKTFPDLEYIKILFDAEKEFYNCMVIDRPPPFVEGDFKLIRKAGAKAMADKYCSLLHQAILEKEDFIMIQQIESQLLEMSEGISRTRIGNIRIQDGNFSIVGEEDATS